MAERLRFAGPPKASRGMHDQGPVLMIQNLRNMKLMQVSRISSPMVALPELLAPQPLQWCSTSDTF